MVNYYWVPFTIGFLRGTYLHLFCPLSRRSKVSNPDQLCLVRTCNDITFEHTETSEVRNYICYEFVPIVDEGTEPDAM